MVLSPVTNRQGQAAKIALRAPWGVQAPSGAVRGLFGLYSGKERLLRGPPFLLRSGSMTPILNAIN